MPPHQIHTVSEADQVGTAVGRMKTHGISQLPVLADHGELVGLITETDVLGALFDDRCTMDTVVAEVMCRKVSTVRLHEEASRLAEVFLRGETAIILDDQDKLIGLLSKLDLIEHLARGRETGPELDKAVPRRRGS
jgi:cystathionine beta-synthase